MWPTDRLTDMWPVESFDGHDTVSNIPQTVWRWSIYDSWRVHLSRFRSFTNCASETTWYKPHHRAWHCIPPPMACTVCRRTAAAAVAASQITTEKRQWTNQMNRCFSYKFSDLYLNSAAWVQLRRLTDAIIITLLYSDCLESAVISPVTLHFIVRSRVLRVMWNWRIQANRPT
jgi:hypothetical protein